MGDRRDSVLAIVLGVLAFGWYLVFAPSGLPPEMWAETAVASSLRAPASVFPGLARYFSMGLFAVLDFGTASATIVFLGRLLCACSVAFAYRLLRYILRCAGTPLEIGTPKRRLAGDVICLTVAVMFALSETMLETSEALSVDSLALFLSFAALLLFFRFLDRGGTVTGGLMLFMFGVVLAESVSGFLLVAIAVTLYLLSIRGLTGFLPRPPSVYVQEFFKWWATLAFALGFFGTIAFNVSMFVACGGLGANGIDLFTAVMRYIVRYGEICTLTATPMGWALIVGVVLFPLVVALAFLPASKSDETFLKWHLGMCYAFLGLFSASQLGSVSGLWFRSWSPVPCVHSHHLAALCGFLSAVTLVISLAVIAIEAFFRNYRRLFQQRVEEADPDFRINYAAVRRRRTALAVVVPAGLIAFAWPGRMYGVRRGMRELLDEGMREIVREIGSAKWVFTDGVLDEGIEIGAALAGAQRVYPLAMMGGAGKYAEYLRTRGGAKGEDLHSLRVSAATAFRDWVLYRPERVAESAFMLGFEMWRVSGKTEPAGSGFLVRTAYGEGERERGLGATRALAERIIAFCGRFAPGRREAAGGLLHRYFCVMMWRMSRLCTLRADAFECAGDRPGSLPDRECANRLDAVNPYCAFIDRYKEAVAGRPREQVTEREKLKLALMRADFSVAALYARSVLESDPANVDAHFAIGMHAYFAKNYALGEVHLVKALDVKPNDGVIWNNLAMCQLGLGNYRQAEKSALEAVRLLPGSSAVSNTLAEIRTKKGGA